MKDNDFRKLAEETRSELRKRGIYGSSSDLYISNKLGIAVIGVQTSQGDQGMIQFIFLKKMAN